MNTLQPKALGLSLGLVFGFGFLLLGLMSMMNGWGTEGVATIGSWYTGYSSSITGSLMGFVWGFLDGFIGGYVIAMLYNKFSR